MMLAIGLIMVFLSFLFSAELSDAHLPPDKERLARRLLGAMFLLAGFMVVSSLFMTIWRQLS